MQRSGERAGPGSLAPDDESWEPSEYTWDRRRLLAVRIGSGAGAGTGLDEDQGQEDEGDEPMQDDGATERGASETLAEKIRVARVNKERSEQLVEKKVLKGQQAEYDTSINLYVNQVAQEAAAQEQENQAKRREANVRARLVLEDQMLEKQGAPAPCGGMSWHHAVAVAAVSPLERRRPGWQKEWDAVNETLLQEAPAPASAAGPQPAPAAAAAADRAAAAVVPPPEH
ncbi:hypothetical protein TSOC_003781 [Tetrabaena socialis]|uniref:Trichohyalin-plectin-homology domain-containing protein n=1 Tax=Tetrabaena socialis TaxID=47790 RepID=A0A2J8AAI8_9CHLO|nr:hypothetical protein TSOC_003781 [Tetrabaena socialis]|eukprot:PNH09539.1 hypothetical protein TSOC_003781 [Tetrabaena socialis]